MFFHWVWNGHKQNTSHRGILRPISKGFGCFHFAGGSRSRGGGRFVTFRLIHLAAAVDWSDTADTLSFLCECTNTDEGPKKGKNLKRYHRYFGYGCRKQLLVYTEVRLTRMYFTASNICFGCGNSDSHMQHTSVSKWKVFLHCGTMPSGLCKICKVISVVLITKAGLLKGNTGESTTESWSSGCVLW